MKLIKKFGQTFGAVILGAALTIFNLGMFIGAQSAGGTGGVHHDLCRITLGSVNLKNTGTSTIFTTPANGQNFHIISVVTEITQSSSFTVAATVSVGTNAASFNNILASFSTQTGANAYTVSTPPAGTGSVAPGTAIIANVSSAATATTATAHFTLIGYFQ